MTSQINTLQDAFVAQGIDINLKPDFSMYPEEVQKELNRNHKNFELEVLIRALNSEGLEKNWEPDYDDSSQPKYEHVYYKSSAGWSLNNVGFWYSAASCGSRRVFRTREIGIYAWKQFPEYFKNNLEQNQ